MNAECTVVLNALPALAADEVTAEARETMERHLSECAACRAARERLMVGVHALSAWEAPVPSPELIAKTLDRIPKSPAVPAPASAMAPTPAKAGPAERPPFRFSLVDTLVAAALVLVTIGILIPTMNSVQKSAKKKECQASLQRLGESLAVYVDRHGSGREYPPVAGSSFWNTLRRLPTPDQSIFPANQHGFFVCAVLGTPANRLSCDFRGPAAGRTFPVTPELASSRVIGADRASNHDSSGADDINVLLIDGRVEVAAYGSTMWARADLDTAN